MKIQDIVEGYQDEGVQDWATRAVGSVLFSKAYEKAVEILHKEMEKNSDNRHSIEYKAAKLLDMMQGGDKLDPKLLAKLYKKEYAMEAKGDIRKGMAAIAMIAALWGVNNNMAQQAYEASPQLQKLTAYLEVAKEHNDQRMIDQLEQRIENHKLRIDMGKGEVMGKDGRPVDVVYDKETK
jgi:hypothetical protein